MALHKWGKISDMELKKYAQCIDKNYQNERGGGHDNQRLHHKNEG